MRLRIALSVLPVVLIVGWLNLAASGDSLYLVTHAIWAAVTLIAIGICVSAWTCCRSVQRNATVDSHAYWRQFCIAGFCALTILSIGVLIAPLAIVLLTFSLLNLAVDFRHRRST